MELYFGKCFLVPALINTIVMTILSLWSQFRSVFFSNLFLWNTREKGNKFVEVIRLTTETLSGIPSIVYGLFGMLFFVNTLTGDFRFWQERLHCLLWSFRYYENDEEALSLFRILTEKAASDLERESFVQYFALCSLSAVPGILAGVILAIGRIVGETAALIYTAWKRGSDSEKCE